MTDLNVFFDSLAGYLVGMAFVEVILKPLIVRMGKSALKAADQASSLPDWVIPDYLWSDEDET